MINRRELIVGGACLAAAAGAETLRPDQRVALLGDKQKLEDLVPRAFGPWREQEGDGIIAPASENSLAARLYNQSVARMYVGPDDKVVMLLIAYGSTQSDTLQLHRPEVCYPAFGFEVTNSRAAQLGVGSGAVIPGRNLIARSPGRQERISYWTRIGEYLPVDNGEQREMRFRIALAGIIPDGVLVRMSNILPEDGPAFALNNRFAADLLQASPAKVRPALITTAKAREVASAVRA